MFAKNVSVGRRTGRCSRRSAGRTPSTTASRLVVGRGDRARGRELLADPVAAVRDEAQPHGRAVGRRPFLVTLEHDVARTVGLERDQRLPLVACRRIGAEARVLELEALEPDLVLGGGRGGGGVGGCEAATEAGAEATEAGSDGGWDAGRDAASEGGTEAWAIDGVGVASGANGPALTRKAPIPSRATIPTMPATGGIQPGSIGCCVIMPRRAIGACRPAATLTWNGR